MSEEKNTLAIEDNREDNRLEDASLVNYEAMSLSELTKELKELLQTEKTQATKKQVDAIRYEFDKKYDALVEEKKEEAEKTSDGEDQDSKMKVDSDKTSETKKEN